MMTGVDESGLVDERNIVGSPVIEVPFEVGTHGFLVGHMFRLQNKMLFLFSHP